MQIDLTAKEIALCISALNYWEKDKRHLITEFSVGEHDDMVHVGVITAVRDRLYDYIEDPDGKLDKREWLQHQNVWSVRRETAVVFKNN